MRRSYICGSGQGVPKGPELASGKYLREDFLTSGEVLSMHTGLGNLAQGPGPASCSSMSPLQRGLLSALAQLRKYSHCSDAADLLI